MLGTEWKHKATGTKGEVVKLKFFRYLSWRNPVVTIQWYVTLEKTDNMPRDLYNQETLYDECDEVIE